MNDAEIGILITARDQASSVMQGIAGKAQGFASKVGGLLASPLGALGGAFAVGGAIKMADNFIGAASDMAESVSKVGVVFDQNAIQIQAWAKTSATSLGLSQQKALEFSGTFGNLFDALGLTSDQMVDMSKGTIQLGTDLASFNNLGVEETLEKLRAGLVGEAEPLRALGVNINAAMVEAKALELGLGDATGEVSEAAKVQARYALIMEQTTSAQGDFARTSGGLANQQKIMAARWENLQVTLGQKLLPIKLALVGFISEKMIPVLEQGGDVIDQITGFIGAWVNNSDDLALRLEALPGPLAAIAGFLVDNRDAIMGYLQVARELVGDVLEGWIRIFDALAPKLQQFGQFLIEHKPLLIALAAALVVVAIAIAGIPALIGLLIVAIGLLITHWETIQAKTIEIWNAIDAYLNGVLGDLVAVFLAHFEMIKTDLENAFLIIRDIVEIVMAIIRGDWSEAWNQIKELGEHIWEAIIEGITTRLQLIVAQFQLAFDTIVLLVRVAFDAVVAYFTWYLTLLVDTVSSIAQGIIDWFAELPFRITTAIGDLYTILYNLARHAVTGFIQGIKDKATDMANAVGDAIGGAIEKGRDILGIGSPSRVFREIGLQSIAGLREGLSAGLPDLELSVQQTFGGSLIPEVAVARVERGAGREAGGPKFAGAAITINVYESTNAYATTREIDRQLRGL